MQKELDHVMQRVHDNPHSCKDLVLPIMLEGSFNSTVPEMLRSTMVLQDFKDVFAKEDYEEYPGWSVKGVAVFNDKW